MREEMLSWCQKPEDELFAQVRRFADGRPDTNPLFVYTVGTKKDDRSQQVAAWIRDRIECREIYTCGMSHEMKNALDSVRGNLSDFAHQSNEIYPEIRPLSSLDASTSVIVVVGRKQWDRKGDYDVIDGAHRTIALCRAGVEVVEAFVARLR